MTAAQRQAPGPSRADAAATHPPSTLPLPLTALLGRDAEVHALTDLLRRPGARLVTLTGPGGVGKTRLALAVAADLAAAFPDGAIFVPLADLHDPQLVLIVLAQRMGLRAAGSRTVAEDLAVHLQTKRLLLVVDNVEHLLPAAPDLATLLEACPHLTMLVTSRAALRLRGEREVRVEPLALPDLAHLPPPEILARSPAVALFLERVAEQRPGFGLSTANAALVAAVCVRLDGLPLALELASAQIRLFSPRALLARLDRRLVMLTSGPRDLPARQRTMSATIAWSYDLLRAEEQALFRWSSVFAGGSTLEAIEAVCRASMGTEGAVLELLRSLVDKSLLRQTEAADGEARFGMLETIREYGLERLGAGELAGARRAHAQHFAALAAEAAPALREAEQGMWLARLALEYDNLRAALRWTIHEGGDPPLGLRLAADLGYFWSVRGLYREGRQWLQEALTRHPAAEHRLRATALTHAGNLVYWLGDLERARAEYEESLALWRAAGDPLRVARGLLNIGNIALEQDAYDRARTLYDEALTITEEAGDLETRARVLNNLGVLAQEQGDHAQALALYEECASIWRELGDINSVAHILANIGDVALELGELARAEDCLRGSLAMRRDLDDQDGVRWSVQSLGFLARRTGAHARAVRLLAAAARMSEQIGAILGTRRQALLEEHVTALREQLGDAAFTAAWAEGQAMAYAYAISYALDPA